MFEDIKVGDQVIIGAGDNEWVASVTKVTEKHFRAANTIFSKGKGVELGGDRRARVGTAEEVAALEQAAQREGVPTPSHNWAGRWRGGSPTRTSGNACPWSNCSR